MHCLSMKLATTGAVVFKHVEIQRKSILYLSDNCAENRSNNWLMFAQNNRNNTHYLIQ